jgi:hypothetical protein
MHFTTGPIVPQDAILFLMHVIGQKNLSILAKTF